MPSKKRLSLGTNLTVAKLFNEIQKSSATHTKCTGMMHRLRAEDPEAFFEDFKMCLKHVLLVFKVHEIYIY